MSAAAPLAPPSRALRKRYVRLGPYRVAHYDEGRGPALLLLHGIPTSCYLWRKVIPLLRNRFRCIAPDLLGLGDTEGPPDADYRMPAQAELIRQLLEAKRIERAHLVCHDQGGAAAQQLVANHPDLIARWVVTNSVCYDNWPVPAVRFLQWVAARPWLYGALSASGIGQELARGRAGFRRAVSDPACLGDAVDEYLRPLLPGRRPATALAAARERFRRFALAGDARFTLEPLPRLQRFPRPILVLWGEEDRFLPLRWGRKLAADLGAELETVPECGHFLPEERPELLAARLLGFLGERPLTSRAAARPATLRG